MLLKRLELQGFKSFADKTILEFVEGSTAVVGPNGSGKSNISDAIRWVIGEMSAKSLRGSNMQDVIFAGTETRKPVNFAEVSLVLDNSSHLFDINYDEVVVTRRLFRSGESVYQINRSNCRLKDIHELFMDTGLGRDGYSIIGQGNVSQILSTKAERKLKGVEENLVRISDITTELEGQRGPLKRQSEKARKYLTYYEEYKGLDVNLSIITIDKNRLAAKEADRLYNSVEEELAELRATESETEQKITSLYNESEQADTEIAEQNKLLREAESKNMETKNHISLFENNIKNNELMLKRIDNEIQSIKDKNIERENGIEKQKAEIEEKNKDAEEMLTGFDSMKEEQDEIAKQKDTLSKEIDSLQGDIIEKQNLIATNRAQINGVENLRSSFIERREVVETEIKTFNEGVSNTKQEIENCKKEISEKSEKCGKMKENPKTINLHQVLTI